MNNEKKGAIQGTFIKKLQLYLPKEEKNRLIKDSLIKTKQISSFDKRRFIKYIGDCNQEVFKEVLLSIKKYLSIDVEDNKDHPTDERTEDSEKSNGESNQQGYESKENKISG